MLSLRANAEGRDCTRAQRELMKPLFGLWFLLHGGVSMTSNLPGEEGSEEGPVIRKVRGSKPQDQWHARGGKVTLGTRSCFPVLPVARDLGLYAQVTFPTGLSSLLGSCLSDCPTQSHIVKTLPVKQGWNHYSHRFNF